MRILVSGGAGFIGSHVVESAVLAGHTVAVLDNLSSGKRQNVPPGVRFYELDLRSREEVRKTLAEFEPEVVSHQAAQASVAVSVKNPHLDAEINVIGGLNLLDACVASGVRKVVFASTGGAIYGEVPEGQFADEHTRPAPISPYAISKLAFEQLLDVYRTHHGLDSTILRYANVYGPRQDPHGEAGVIAIFFDTVLKGGTLQINARKREGDDGCVRDYVFVSDVARANLAALAGTLPERVMNVGTGATITTLELAREIARVSGRELAHRFGPPRAGDIERSVLDSTRFVRALGDAVPLAAGLGRTFEWYRSVA
ncbi:MAG TPA: NAD-dependent epimerase/dehydratase family protein [Polyangiaceae bacterium]|jgi:UDP-glucose 4-epimerase|nr:NAD-dependent epimerase/dehydratase family protein [Polyangiaceae bacterium]